MSSVYMKFNCAFFPVLLLFNISLSILDRYVSFVEIFSSKAITAFASDDQVSDAAAYRYATLTFFGGFLIIAILDKIVHLISDCAGRRGIAMHSASRANLLANEDAATATNATRPPSVSNVGEDVEAANEGASASTNALAVAQTSPKKGSAVVISSQTIEGREGGCEAGEDCQKAPGQAPSPSREPPAVVELMQDDCHNFALKKMGILTAAAIFIHNFPEGLATFVATLADSEVGIGVAVAIAMHNIPEGICVAMPIYYATGSRWKGFWWACLSGASEPLGALVGYLALYNSSQLGYGIVFALVAGMMVYISVKELLPTALRYDPRDKVTTTCVVLGMIVIAGSLVLFTL